MIAKDGDEARLVLQSKQSINDATRVWAAVHVVSEGDESVIRLGGKFAQKQIQGCGAAMDVADDEGAHKERKVAEVSVSATKNEHSTV